MRKERERLTNGRNGPLIRLFYVSVVIVGLMICLLAVGTTVLIQNRSTGRAVKQSLENHRQADKQRAADATADRAASNQRLRDALAEVQKQHQIQMESLERLLQTHQEGGQSSAPGH